MLKYAVLQPLFYTDPNSALCNTVLKPRDGYAVTFGHLRPSEVALLVRKRFIKQLTPEAAAELTPAPLKEL